MKTTTAKVATVYALLLNAKFTKLKTSERSAIIKARRPMKDVAVKFEDFRKDAFKDLRPDNYDDMAKLITEFNEMTEEERKAALGEREYLDALKANAKYQEAVADCIKEEAEKEIDLDITTLTRESFNKLLDSNLDWTFANIDQLEEILCPVTEKSESVEPETEE